MHNLLLSFIKQQFFIMIKILLTAVAENRGFLPSVSFANDLRFAAVKAIGFQFNAVRDGDFC